MNFYVGIHHPNWLTQTDVPLFVSRSSLEHRKTLPRALGRWALDSGGFTEIDRHHRWLLPADDYVRLVRRCHDEIGNLDWAAPQDWMCEPSMLAKTGLSVGAHQRLTTDNYLELRHLDADLPIIPVLQGWDRDDYLRHIDAYLLAGIDLTREPLVGVGTVCKRQDTFAARQIFRAIVAQGIRCHGFGIKIVGLTDKHGYADALTSADSFAWSYAARKKARQGEPSCDPSRRISCSNCLHYAIEWRQQKILDRIPDRLYEEAPCPV